MKKERFKGKGKAMLAEKPIGQKPEKSRCVSSRRT